MKYKSAYTLIELLVGISITAIIFTSGIAGYREFSRRQMLTSVVKTLKSELRTIQQLATSGQKPTGITCTRLNGYSLDRINSYQYNLVANCSDGDTVIKTVDLPNEISFVSAVDPISFKVLGQGTNLSAGIAITFTFNATGKTEMIIIGKGGYVQ